MPELVAIYRTDAGQHRPQWHPASDLYVDQYAEAVTEWAEIEEAGGTQG